jgi:tetratricopeptide (TPR) repeat protein
MHNLVDGVDAQRVEGKVLSRQGRQKEANATLERALSRARSIPYPYAEAKILHEYGVLHALQGEPGQARERHSAALGIFRRLGASEDAGRTEQALQKLE